MINLYRYIKEKADRVLVQIAYVPFALSLVWHAARGWTIAWAALLIIRGILPVATVCLSKLFVDGIVNAVKTQNGPDNLSELVTVTAALASALLILELSRGLLQWVRTNQAEHVKDYISGLVQKKSLSLDIAYFESSIFYDKLYWALTDAAYRPLAMIESIGNLLQSGITLASMAVILFPYGYWLPLVLVFSTLPSLFVTLYNRFKMHEWKLAVTPDERKVGYYTRLMASREAAAEMRLFGLGDYFQNRFQELRSHLRSQYLSLIRRQYKADFAVTIATFFVTGATMAWMLWRVVDGQISLGDLTLIYQAFLQGQRLLGTILGTVGELYSNSLFLETTSEFLNLESKIEENDNHPIIANQLNGTISFENVSFRYPDCKTHSLYNLNLKLEAGKTTAVVGKNGAGKSTLIKLLCRFYDPDSGSVRFGGNDLRDLPLNDLRGMITAMFQEPVYFQGTVAENIFLGDLQKPVDENRVRQAAAAAGADRVISKFPNGIDTTMGKWFAGGTDVSVGEWQRIALARAFYRDAPIIVLDEPTSAMDSWAEAEWVRNFRFLAKGRTALIITHRFTTAMHADVIHVIDSGRIIESGNHEELLLENGSYAASWRSQIMSADTCKANAN